ncbi:S26 family signal peptidase [Sphingomonas lycopersici]|uniref:S26 family signal peptidase n=1 Tax=Sphingomonas lycopersici TaxID=2951807 RepID=A0AA42CV92_9SPHN|nr:S26 family signal peptidase [Sphingomonas lycopersici]MCW6536256.1 S26 family signal peptidase [Sphingomonas lycopersici]
MTRRTCRIAAVLAGPVFAILFAANAALPSRPRFIWNASASAPIGLYAIHAGAPIGRFDLVAVMPPEPLAAFLARRDYLAGGVPLLKHVLGVAGQRICRSGSIVTIDGMAVAAALPRDRAGRALPVWQGCRRLAAGEVFLVNQGVRDSFDGRYFGPIPTRQIIGRAAPLWTDEHADGRFEWRASPR